MALTARKGPGGHDAVAQAPRAPILVVEDIGVGLELGRDAVYAATVHGDDPVKGNVDDEQHVPTCS